MLRHQHICLLLILLCAISHFSIAYKIRDLRSEPEEEEENALTEDARDDDDDDDTTDDTEDSKKTEIPAEGVLPILPDSTLSTIGSADLQTGTAPEGPPDSFYIVSSTTNEVCLALKIEAGLQIMAPESKSLEIDDSAKHSGHCGTNSSPVITITWDHSNLTLRINKSAESDEWAITRLQLEYTTDDKTVKMNAKSEDLKPYTAPLGQALKCGDHSLSLYSSDDEENEAAAIVFKDLLVQAYNVPSRFGDEHICSVMATEPPPTPKKKFQSDVAPVAVGSVLAILTLLMLAGYAIHRSMNTKKPDYSNME